MKIYWQIVLWQPFTILIDGLIRKSGPIKISAGSIQRWHIKLFVVILSQLFVSDYFLSARANNVEINLKTTAANYCNEAAIC